MFDFVGALIPASVRLVPLVGCACALLALLGRPAALAAQRAEEIPEFSKLRTTESPAFVILGVSPTVVERPSSPKAVAVSLLSALTADGEDESIFPRNFALEVTPYWLVPRPGLTWQQYQAGGPASLYRTFTLSLATTTDEEAGGDPSPEDRSATSVGVGLRTTPFRGHVADTTCIAELRASLRAAAKEIGARVAQDIASGRLSPSDSTAIEARRAELADEILSGEQQSCVEEVGAREGFLMDLAGALAIRFPQQVFDDGSVSGWAVWATPSLIARRLSAVGVLRYGEEDGVEDLSASRLDAGLRGIVAWDRYAASLEAVYRRVDDVEFEDDLYRLNLGFDVKLSGALWLTASFGRDFRGDDAGSLLALANFKWNFGDPSIQPPSSLRGEPSPPEE